jgi:hypothetical protein
MLKVPVCTSQVVPNKKGGTKAAHRLPKMHQLSSKARVRNQCSSALPSGQPSRSHSA